MAPFFIIFSRAVFCAAPRLTERLKEATYWLAVSIACNLFWTTWTITTPAFKAGKEEFRPTEPVLCFLFLQIFKLNFVWDLQSRVLFVGSVQPPKWSRPRNDPQPWNDPQIDPEMIPTPKWSPLFFSLTPKWFPKNYGMAGKHGTVDWFFVLCWNAQSWHFFLLLLSFT